MVKKEDKEITARGKVLRKKLNKHDCSLLGYSPGVSFYRPSDGSGGPIYNFGDCEWGFVESLLDRIEVLETAADMEIGDE